MRGCAVGFLGLTVALPGDAQTTGVSLRKDVRSRQIHSTKAGCLTHGGGGA